MSHATLTVRITADRLASAGSIDNAVSAMMEPFEESPKEGSPYIVFDDSDHDEQVTEWETESTEKIRCEDGALVSEFDDRFRVAGTFGWSSSSHRVLSHLERVQVPYKVEYPTFEEFVTKYHGAQIVNGRAGSWHNPNAKWDWWQIGGRWRGFYPVRPGVGRKIGQAGTGGNAPADGSDIALVRDIDMDAVAKRSEERAAEFWSEYRDALAGKTFDVFEGPRETAMRIGLCRVVKGPHEAAPGEHVDSWSKHKVNDERRAWNDVWVASPDEKAYAPFFNVLRTFAVLDDAGWHEGGEMGWFGCDDGKADDHLAFARAFMDMVVKSASPSDTLVLVDYHI